MTYREEKLRNMLYYVLCVFDYIDPPDGEPHIPDDCTISSTREMIIEVLNE